MPTYHNAYSILEAMRYGVNEHTSGLVQETETHGKYKNAQLMQYANEAQTHIYNMVMSYVPEAFLASESVSVVSSIITLPWDFGRLIRLLDADGKDVTAITVHAILPTTVTGSDNKYYRKGNTLVLQKSGVTDTYTLWYQRRPRELNQGSAQAGAAGSITLAATASLHDDYYNGMIIEDVTAGFVDTIDDYVGSTKVATVTGSTAVAADFYGTVSDIPETFHFLIAPRAIQIAKTIHPASQEKPSKQELFLWAEQMAEAIRAFGGNSGDVRPESVWCDFGGGISAGGVSVLDQGYTIY